MITSAKNSSWKSDFLLKKLNGTGLNTPSIVRQKIFTIDQSLIIKELGKLSPEDIKQIKNKLNDHLSV